MKIRVPLQSDQYLKDFLGWKFVSMSSFVETPRKFVIEYYVV